MSEPDAIAARCAVCGKLRIVPKESYERGKHRLCSRCRRLERKEYDS